MAKSFFRTFTDQITGGNGKTTDIQVVQAINRFGEEHSKLLKFKREFNKYTQAILEFDNASYRFFGFVRSFTDSAWSQQPALIQSYTDIERIRSEHLQRLNRQINASIGLSFDKFDIMKLRIDEQDRIQHDYDRTRKQYHSSVRHDDSTKVDRIKTELDQLKSTLNSVNTILRDDLPKFHLDIQNHYLKTVLELFDIHGNYYKISHKLCSGLIKKFRKASLPNTENNANDVQSTKKKSFYCIPLSQPTRTDYKSLHQARVIHDYKAENEDEIDLIKDEYITVISFQNEEDNERDKGWEYAEKSDGSIGLFPVNFATRLYDNEVKQ